MAYSIMMSEEQLRRIVKALDLLEQTDPAGVAALKFDPDGWEGENIQYLLGCARDTLMLPDTADVTHGWNM